MFDRLIVKARMRALSKRYLQRQAAEWHLAHGRWSKEKRQLMDALTAIQEDRAKIRGRLTDMEEATWRVLDADSLYGQALRDGSHDELMRAQKAVWQTLSELRRVLDDHSPPAS